MSSHESHSARRGHRTARLERLVAEILDCDVLPSLEDPALQGLHVLHLELRNMACIHATLRVENPVADDETVRAALARCEGRVRTELAERLRIKRMPILRLHYIAVPRAAGWDAENGGGHA